MSNEQIKQVNIAYIGIGSVGKLFLEVLNKKKTKLRDQYKLEFKIVLLADSSGIAFDKRGFSEENVLNLKKSGKKLKDMEGFTGSKNVSQFISENETNIQVLFEASPVDLKTGDPALSTTITALKKGIHVVLANKGPLAVDYDRVMEAAKEGNAKVMFSATVCAGLPIVNDGRNMVGATITKFRGVFNATTNFILGEMGKNRAYSEALKEAQERGIAETDPTLDVEGWDTANKLLICCRSVLNLKCKLSDIKVEGITKVTKEMIEEAKRENKVYKLVATVETSETGEFSASVSPIAVQEREFIASIEGWETGVEIHSDIYGIYYYKLWEREPISTASSMIRDAVNILTNQTIA